MPFKIEAQSSFHGMEHKQSFIRVNDQPVMAYQNVNAGVFVTILDGEVGFKVNAAFDVYAGNKEEWDKFASFITNNLKNEDILIIVTRAMTPHLKCSNLAKQKLAEIGVPQSTINEFVSIDNADRDRVPWVFVRQTSSAYMESIVGKKGVWDSTVCLPLGKGVIPTTTERKADHNAAQGAESLRQIAETQKETAKQVARAKQAEIDRLAAVKAQQEAEKKVKLAEEKAEKERLAKQQERLCENLEKGQQVIASQKKVLTRELSSLHDTVSFLRKMDRQKVIPEAILREMGQELLTAENNLTLKK